MSVNKYYSQVEEVANVTYDVQFDDDTDSNSLGINGTYQECIDWIDCNRHDKSTYFGDYVGGTVSVVCVESGEFIYSEEINND